MQEPYGKRLNRATWTEYKRFWSGMRLIATFSGIIAPVILQLQRGVSAMLPLAEAMESGAIGLALSIFGTYLYSRRQGAESLDLEWQTSASATREKHEETTSSLLKQLDQNRQRITDLAAALAQKHPQNLKQEAAIRTALQKLTTQQRNAIEWLLDAGEASRGILHNVRGLDVEHFHSGNTEFPPLFIVAREDRPGNGTVVMERYYAINPEMKQSLRNVLHPHPTDPAA